MKRKFYYLVFLIAVTGSLMTGCKSASKLYKLGNYDEAVAVAVKKLQKKPGDAEMKALIQNAYQYAIADHERRIQEYTANTSDLKYDWIYAEYRDLQNLYEAIHRAPEVFDWLQPTDYSSYTTQYREKAAEAHSLRGKTWMKDGDRESAKKAYREFQVALGFKPGDVSLQQWMSDAYDAAVTRIVIMPPANSDYLYSSYHYNAPANTADEIIRNLAYNSGNEFVRFYSALEARSHGIEPDQVVEMNWNAIHVGQVQENRNTIERTKEVVIRETVYKPDSVVKEYKNVKARLTTTRRVIYSEGNLSLVIRDAGGNRLWSDFVAGQHNWSTVFSSYTGDERALSEEDKHFINNRADNIPSPSYIINGVQQDILQKTFYRIKDYYSRY